MQVLLIAQNYCQNSDNFIPVNSVGRVRTSRAFALPTFRGTLELVFATGALHTASIRQTVTPY